MIGSDNNIVPNKDQQEGLEKIAKFMKSNERVFLLSGKAGTGKTTLLSMAFNTIIGDDQKKIIFDPADEKNTYSIIGVAMAHKAKNNLRERGGIPYVNTFASTYGHKEIYDERSGERKFVPDKDKIKFADCKKPFKIFVIDEVSMFTQKMLELVFKETNMRAKIIFLGDRGQLPPILENKEPDYGQDSPVWDLKLPDFCKHELVERVRQTDGNPIVELSDIIYAEIFAPVPNLRKVVDHINIDCFLNNGQGYLTINEEDIYLMFKCSSEDYMDTKIIAYTNKAVNNFNFRMRNFIHDYPQQQFIKNEIIYMNETFYGKDTNGNKFAFYNSSEFLIRNINHGEIDGIKVIYSELEDSKWMPIVKGNKGHINYELYRDRLLEYSNAKKWREFWGFKSQFGDFSYGYTLTAYKAQGSTYKNVYISLSDILGIMMLSDKRKLQTLYTSITRASHNVTFLQT
jgi:exodeoxyribonuclease-5